QFEWIAGAKLVNEIGRNLSIIHALHGQAEQFIFGRRGDRIAALRLVAVCGRETNIDMLARQVSLPSGYVQHQALYPISFDDDFRRRFPALELAATRVAARAGPLSQSPSYRCSFQGSP